MNMYHCHPYHFLEIYKPLVKEPIELNFVIKEVWYKTTEIDVIMSIYFSAQPLSWSLNGQLGTFKNSLYIQELSNPIN